MLGPGNEEAAEEALWEWPGALQIGGGISEANSKTWIDKGAEKVNNHIVSQPLAKEMAEILQ